jgi:hypothetical protein
MLSQYGPKQHVHPGPRPLWQLLLAAQTDQLSSLTDEECQALIEFLGDLIPEGLESKELRTRIARCLARSGKKSGGGNIGT